MLCHGLTSVTTDEFEAAEPQYAPCTLKHIRPKKGWETESMGASSKLEVEINGTIYISTAARKNEGGRQGRKERGGMANIT